MFLSKPSDLVFSFFDTATFNKGIHVFRERLWRNLKNISIYLKLRLELQSTRETFQVYIFKKKMPYVENEIESTQGP